MTLIIVNTMGEAKRHDVRPDAVRDAVALRYLQSSLDDFDTREMASYGPLSLPHPVAIPGKGWTPQSGGASEVAHV